MRWCPRCRTEHPAAAACPVCGGPLSVPADDPAAPVVVASGLPAMDCRLLLAALKDGHIPAYSRVPDSFDAIRKTYCGTTLHGEEVLVASADFPEAAALVEGVLSGGGRYTVNRMADEIALMPLEETPVPAEPAEPGEGPVKYAVLAALSILALLLLHYLAGL